MKALPLLGLLLCAACRAPAGELELRARADAAPLHVAAADEALAQRVLELAHDVLPIVLALPGLEAPRSLELRITRARGAPAAVTHWRGALEERRDPWIELALDDDPDAQRFLVGHELAHALLDRTWQHLPQIVEEGLADRAGERASPGYAARRRLAHAVRLASWTGAGLVLGGGAPLVARLDEDALRSPEELLALDGRTYHALRPAENRELAYAFGYLIVERVGIEALRQMCAQAEREGRAKLGAAELLAAARLDPRDRRTWARAVEALARPRE